MVDEPRRSGFVTWILMGLGVVLVLGTAAGVAVPIFRCPGCRIVASDDGTRVRRIRVDGRWAETTGACPCCVDRRKVTALNYLLTGLQNQRRR